MIELLIIFNDLLSGVTRKQISGVKAYGVLEINPNMFYFVKNGRNTFIPAENVIYFGPAFDYGEES